MRAGDTARAWAAARDLHRACPLPFPLNVSRLLEQVPGRNIRDVSSALYNAGLPAGSTAALHPRRAWALYDEGLDAHLIVWNRARPRAAIRYSVAHELGHILLGHQGTNRPGGSALGKAQKEAQADAFASCLLAPFWAVQAVLQHQPFNARLVARHFDMPLSAAARMKQPYEAWTQRHPAPALR